MSLVSEALRKARREAAERGENLDGRAAQTTVIQVTRGPRARHVIAVGAIVAVAAAALGAAAVWWLVGAASGPETADRGDAPPMVAPPTTSPTAVSEAAPDQTGVTAPVPQATTTPTARRRLLPPTPRPTTPTPVRDPAGPVAPVPTEPQTPDSSDTRPATLGPNEFLGEATVNGRRLVLDYIAYLPTGAFAEINGTEVRLGSRIEGLTVEAITATAVTLRGPDGPIVLRAR